MFSGSSGPFYSLTDELNEDSTPSYIAQITDVHYHDLYPERTKHNTEIIKSILDYFDPHVLTITGDIADSSDSKNMVKFHKYFQKNWDEWNKSYYDSGLHKKKEDGTVFIPVAGNHDQMAIPDDTPENNPFRRYFLNDEDDFIIQTYEVANDGQKDFNLVAFNPVFPPASSGPLSMMPFVTEETLKKLEQTIKEDHINILLCHFPRGLLWSNKDASGKKIRELTKRFDLMLTGHTHPMSLEVTRNDGLLHVVGAVEKETDNFTLVTFDNNMPSIHNIKADTQKQLIVTYPISSDSITSKCIFNKNSFDVRVLYFSGSDKADIKLSIDGVQKTDKMTYVSDVKEGATFYKYPVSDLSDGYHDIFVEAEGAVGYHMQFFVGSTYPKHSDGFSMNQLTMAPFTLGIAVFCSIYTIIRIIPLWLIPGAKELLNKFSDLMEGKAEEAADELPKWKVLLIGCLDYITRFRRLGLISYIVLIFDTLWIFFIPVYIAPVEYKRICVFVWGTTIDGDIKFFMMTFMVWMFYSLLFLLPIGSFAALWREPKLPLWEMIIFGIVLLFIVIVWFIVAYFAGDVFTMFASPMTYIAVISIVLVIIDNILINRKERNQQVQSSEEPPVPKLVNEL